MPLSFEPALDHRPRLADILGAFPFPALHHATVSLADRAFARHHATGVGAASARTACVRARSSRIGAVRRIRAARRRQRSAERSKPRITSYLTQKFGVAKERAAKLADIVSVTATKYSLPPALVYAIISIESRFQEKARGQHGATGLMQVVPTAHRGLVRNVKDLTDPNANVEVGSAILSGYVRAAGGDVRAGLRSYSGGSNAYAAKVMQRVDSFRFVLEPDDDAKAVNPANPANDAKARMVPVSEKTSPASARGN